VAGFEAEQERLMTEFDPAAMLLQLSLVGITSTTDRVAIPGMIEHDLRHLDLCADDLVARPSDDDVASVAGEGMLRAAAAKLYTKMRAREGMRRWLSARLCAFSANIRGMPLRGPRAVADHRQQLP